MKFSGMSPAELQFIRLYVTTLRREYYLLRSVMDLMHPTGLGIKSFTAAANMAVELDGMHKDFEAQLARVQKKDKLKKSNIPIGPTMNELADMFSLSFFKLVTVEDTPETGKVKTDDGWFSGKPNEWKKTLQLYKNTPKDAGFSLPDLLSNFFNTLLKFFPSDLNHKTWHEGPWGPTKKMWPPANEYNADDQYFDDDDDDEDDNGMSPFDMFFQDDDDN
jgi:hypothetical protein